MVLMLSEPTQNPMRLRQRTPCDRKRLHYLLSGVESLPLQRHNPEPTSPPCHHCALRLLVLLGSVHHGTVFWGTLSQKSDPSALLTAILFLDEAS